MACPFFIPTERLHGVFAFPDRLPLAAGYSGMCGAPGQMLAKPTDDELREHCNLGHASCARLPQERVADSVRFVARDGGHHRVSIRYVYETGCRPAGGGVLEWDDREQRWLTAVEDERLLRQAECYLKSWRTRQRPAAAAAHS